MIEDPPVQLTISAGAGTVVLNRPDKRNALARSVLQGLLAALEELDRDETVRVVVLKGAGKAFCAGMDLEEMLADRDERGFFDYALLPDVLERLAAHRNPTIAVVQGPAFAGGCELALHCDIRIGTPEARFAMPLARLGLVAPAYALKRLIETVGVSAARDLLLTADVVDASTALRIGILNRLTTADELGEHVTSLVRRIVECSPTALREMKRALTHMTSRLEPELLAELDAARIEIARTSDMREGVRAFLDRRPPVFRGG